ncbi:MAG: zinc-dependent alcohol dehydrogenase family protein [Anaerostipes sp.]|nr:zinc-dependent alcohol dehydrogenase family protein [Anaerostipes sp.]
MKAVVLEGKESVRVGEFKDPVLEKGSVKVEIAYCGLCGTDVHKFQGKGGSRPVTYPVPLGHEASGVVCEVGEDVTEYKVGDRVTIDPNWSCGHCYYCKEGITHMCENSRGVSKGLAEYVCAPQENIYKIPDEVTLKEAALTEPLSCCLHGMDLLDVKLGDTVAIIGMGSIGSIVLELCKKASAGDIIVIEANEEKREKAMAMGTTLFVNPLKENVMEKIEQAGIKNVNRVMECVGINDTIETALQIAGKKAIVVLFGLPDPKKDVPIKMRSILQREIEIRTSFLNPNTTERAIHILKNKDLDLSQIVSMEMPMENVPEELKSQEYMRNGKVIVKIKGES